jgi:DNA mismatch repair protein MutL
MGKIIVLDELTASQIAAGEVIERPASVVKETVENSIDAGATSVVVEIRNGGIKYIRVTDNGSGFDPDDAVIAFDKHATSKIHSGDDLATVSTLGFRGEALASIASVADVELLSRTEKEDQGVYVRIRGGDLLECSRRGSPKGTVLTVKDLFFNVPARYKFLKKDQTEAGYVAETLEKLALANPDVAFRLISNGQEILRTPGSGLEAALYSIFGKEGSKDLLKVYYTDGENTVTGFTGVRGNIFGTRARQYFFVNGRAVKSRVISSAVDEAYKTVTMKHQFPMCVLSVNVPVSKLDVNVHPAKTEVRFASERSVFSTVYSALSNALLSENRTAQEPAKAPAQNLPPRSYDFPSGGVSTVEKPVENSRNMWKSPAEKAENQVLTLDLASENPPRPALQPENRTAFEQTKKTDMPAVAEEKTAPFLGPEKAEQGTPETKPSEHEMTKPVAADLFVAQSIADAHVTTSTPVEPSEQIGGTYNEKDVFLNSRIIGQYLKTYILLEYDGELVIIDQHAAHERIKYESICEALDRADAKLPVSPLLIPVTVRMSAAEKLWLDGNIDAFTSIGFEIDDFGPDTVAVRTIPSSLSEADPEDLLLSGIRAAMSSKGSPKDVFRTEAVDTMACKAAVKANQALSTQEIKGLLASLATLKNSATCPHGRPIVVRITSHELEKRFRRCL